MIKVNVNLDAKVNFNKIRLLDILMQIRALKSYILIGSNKC